MRSVNGVRSIGVRSRASVGSGTKRSVDGTAAGTSRRVGSGAKPKMKPVATAMSRLKPIRPAKTGVPPKVAQVLAITTALITGAERRKLTAAERGRPLCSSRRTSGTTPHSQTGNNNPMSAPATGARNRFFGTARLKSDWPKKTSTSPEPNVPSIKNGAASMKMPRKIVANVSRC